MWFRVWLFLPVPESPGRSSQEQPGPREILMLKPLYGCSPQMCHGTQTGCDGDETLRSCTWGTDDPERARPGQTLSFCGTVLRVWHLLHFSTCGISLLIRHGGDLQKDSRLRRGGLILCLFPVSCKLWELLPKAVCPGRRAGVGLLCRQIQKSASGRGDGMVRSRSK